MMIDDVDWWWWLMMMMIDDNDVDETVGDDGGLGIIC